MARVKFVEHTKKPAPRAQYVPSSPPTASTAEDDTPTMEPLRRSLRNMEKSSTNAFETRWDDWVPQDRLRKLTEDNRELAASLRRDVMQAESRQRIPKAAVSSKKGRTQGSEIDSGRGSEDRNSSVPAGGRGTKRGKDNEIEKVATPDFPTPRRSSRMQSTGYSPIPILNSPDPTISGLDQDDQTDAEAAMLLSGLRYGSSATTKSNKGGAFKLEDAPRGRGGVSDRGVKTVVMRTIHGQYDENMKLIPGTKEVVSRRGYFKDGNYSSPELDTATSIKSQAGSRLSRHSQRSGQRGNEQKQPLTMPDEATCTRQERYEFVMDLLSRPPPPDEPEHMTIETFRSGYHWAPLIGGTSENERAQIEEEAREMGMWFPQRQPVHPQYAKCRVNDPLNAARLAFFENQDPDRKLMVAGVPKDPIHIDPPGSGGPFDALKFPDRLVRLDPKVLGNLSMTELQQLDRATITRFPNSALQMLPPRFLSKLKIPIPSASTENDSNDNYFQEEAFFARPSVHIPVPDMIKGYLVDDWENVTKSQTLVELPSKAPVNWLLDTYFHEEKGKRRLGSPDADRFVEIVDGMKTYFEKMLGKTLLYRFERGQYADVYLPQS
jgi:MRG